MIHIAATEGVCVRPSEHGLGVLAIQRFDAGHPVGRVRGTIIEAAGYGSDYCMDLGEGGTLEPHPPFRFLNHSCDPNCELILYDPDDEDTDGEMWVETLRAIEPGEELTIDYAWPAAAAIPCACRSRNCRGWIVAQSELHHILEPKPQRRNGHHPRHRKRLHV